ncbi:protein of unknown function [Caballeronia sp. S22]
MTHKKTIVFYKTKKEAPLTTAQNIREHNVNEADMS